MAGLACFVMRRGVLSIETLRWAFIWQQQVDKDDISSETNFAQSDNGNILAVRSVTYTNAMIAKGVINSESCSSSKQL